MAQRLPYFGWAPGRGILQPFFGAQVLDTVVPPPDPDPEPTPDPPPVIGGMSPQIYAANTGVQEYAIPHVGEVTSWQIVSVE